MTTGDWRGRAGTLFIPEKRPAMASRGMVVTNHLLGSAAGPRCWPRVATRSTPRSPRSSP